MSSKKLTIAIFGRPNVGKSTLFNQITGTRAAVVKDEPGVTRDVHYGKSDWCGVAFNIFDTAGVSEGGDKAWSKEIREKALEAVKLADKVIFVLDGKFGLNPEDRDLALYIKRLKTPVLTVVNKIDTALGDVVTMSEFFELDMNPMMPASFEHKHGLDEILNWIIEGQPKNVAATIEDNQIRIAVIGKPNAGKSTLVNSILGEKRVVVSPVAGTTIDSIEVPFEKNGRDYILVDTAGLRRRAKRTDHVERISAIKSEEAVEMSNILLLMIDGLEGPTVQDSRIVEMALEHHRAVIIVVNKLDAAEKKIPRFRETTRAKLKEIFHYYDDIPIAFVSAKTGRGVDTLFELVETIWMRLNKRISTRDINQFFLDVIRQAPHPSFRGHDIKFYYITQTKQRPPSFMAYVNEPRGITNAYRRFVVHKIKEHYELDGIPVRFFPKKRRRGDTRAVDVKYGQVPAEVVEQAFAESENVSDGDQI